ncbi:hypothetical protein ACHAWF_008542 [Thalassiosira exigua]
MIRYLVKVKLIIAVAAAMVAVYRQLQLLPILTTGTPKFFNSAAPTKAKIKRQDVTNFDAITLAKKVDAPVDIPRKHFKSQDREDRKLMKWFGRLAEGTYLEMGGFDGIWFSNSYVFNKALGWKGVLVELIEENYDKMVENRPKEIANIHAGVCGSTRTLHSVRAGPLSAVGGIYELAAPSFRERWWKNIALDSPDIRKIKCDTLDRLLLKHAPNVTFFDFFSLDVEGAELTVLESTDFDRVRFGIIFVEASSYDNVKNLVMRRFLERKGYTYLFDHGHGPSYWFANPNFDKIYKHLHLDINGKEEDGVGNDSGDSYYY